MEPDSRVVERLDFCVEAEIVDTFHDLRLSQTTVTARLVGHECQIFFEFRVTDADLLQALDIEEHIRAMLRNEARAHIARLLSASGAQTTPSLNPNEPVPHASVQTAAFKPSSARDPLAGRARRIGDALREKP